MKVILVTLNILIFTILSTQFLYAEQSVESENELDSENNTENRRRKSCLRDFRQCARKTIENYDDKRGSNARACERWKNVCKIHYPAIFKTIDDTTNYKVITKDEFVEFQRLQRENKKSVKVEKDGNKTITITTEIDDDGNEKVTKTIETLEEIKDRYVDFDKSDDSSNIKNEQNHMDDNDPELNLEYKNISDTENNSKQNPVIPEENKQTEIEIEIKDTTDINDKDEEEISKNMEASDIIKKSFNVNNISVDKTEEKNNIDDENTTEPDTEEHIQEENANS